MGCWYLGGKRHRKESATQRQAAVITVKLCNKTKRENKEGADVGGVWSREGERDLPHLVNSLFVTFFCLFCADSASRSSCRMSAMWLLHFLL